MKRFAVLIAIILSVTVFLAACSEKNLQSPSEDTVVEDIEQPIGDNTQDDSDNHIDLSERLSQAYIDLMKGEKYTMTYKVFMDIDGSVQEMDFYVVISGENKAIKMSSEEFENLTLTMEDEIYVVNHENKTIMVMSLDTTMSAIEDEMVDPSDIDAASIEYIGSGQKEFMGNMRDYEEYETLDSRVIYYFNGKDLDGMEIIYEDDSFLMDIVSISGDVDESIFELPSDYQVIRLGN